MGSQVGKSRMVPPGQSTGNNGEWEVVGLCKVLFVAFGNNSMVVEDGDRTLSRGKAGNSPELPHPNLVVFSDTSLHSHF